MIVLLVVIGVAAIAIVGRKYANTALPTVLALALCCCLSLGIYFYASAFSRAGELVFAAVGGVLLSAGIYALTNALCRRRAVLQDSAARIAGPRKPLVEFVEPDEQEREEKDGKDPEKMGPETEEKEDLPKLWEEESPESEPERRAFDEALDEALFADTEDAAQAQAEEASVKAEMDALQVPFTVSPETLPDTEENAEPEPAEGNAEAENETISQTDALVLLTTAGAEEISEHVETMHELFTPKEEESSIPPLSFEEMTPEAEEVIENAEIQHELSTIEEQESEIPPLALEEIAEDFVLAEELGFLPPLDEETEEAEQAEETTELSSAMKDEADPEESVEPARSYTQTDKETAVEEAGMVEFDAARFIRFIEEDPESAESKMAEPVEPSQEEVIESETAKLFDFVEKADETVEPETVESADDAVEISAKDIAKDSEPFKESFEASEHEVSESAVHEQEEESEAGNPVVELFEKPAFEPVPAPDDFQRRKDEAMAEVKALVAKRQYSDALTSLFALLNSGFALSEDEKRQLLIIMKLLKEKGI